MKWFVARTILVPARQLQPTQMPPRKRARAAEPAADIIIFTSVAKSGDALAEHVEQISSLYESGELCDGEVKHCSTTYSVSRMNLAAASKFFRVAFVGGMRESTCASVTVDPSMPAACLEALLHYAHSGTLKVPNGLEEELMSAADQLEFLSVLPILMPRLTATVSAENCLNRLTLATRRELTALTERAVQVVDTHFATLAAAHAFNELPEDALTAILHNPNIQTAEVQLYETLVAWCGHRTERSFDMLLEHISLADLGIKYLLESVMHSPLVLASARARDLVKAAMGHLTLNATEREDLAVTTIVRHRMPYIDLSFCRPAGQTSPHGTINIVEAGKVVSRESHNSWKGAIATELLPSQKRAAWCVQVTSGLASVSSRRKFFLGIARADVGMDMGGNDGFVGIELIFPTTGDQLIFTADPQHQRLEYSFALAGSRTVADISASVQSEFQEADVEVSDRGTLTWTHGGEHWAPFVAMNAGTYASPSTVRVIDMARP